MIYIRVAGKNRENIGGILQTCLEKTGRACVYTAKNEVYAAKGGGECVVVDASNMPASAGQAADITVMSGAPDRRLIPERCQVAILCGSERPDAACLSGQVLGVGSSPKDTLTFSSIAGGKLVAALLRDISALDGTPIPAQEFPIEMVPGAGLDDMLAVGAALLVMGALPDTAVLSAAKLGAAALGAGTADSSG